MRARCARTPWWEGHSPNPQVVRSPECAKQVPESYGCTHTLLHRHLHRLIDAQRVKVLSKGAQGKLVLLVV
jgi:hypothetical protein